MNRRCPANLLWLALTLAVGVFLTPGVAHAMDRIYRYGYRTERAWVVTPFGAVWAAPAIGSAIGVGITGAPLHGIVCSRGTLAELPPERQTLYIDGATVGHPGYRCLDFH